MTATTAPAPARDPHLAAVRVGKGTVTHLGHRTTLGTPDAPLYSPLCGAGSRYPDDDSPFKTATGAPVDERVTCKNCTGRYAHAVATIHAAQDADRAPAPAVVWGVIASAAGGTAQSPARRLRGAWINAAQRAVYRLPAVAHDGRSLDPDVIRAREADTRDVDTRALDYLAAFAALLDDRAEPVDRLALRFAAPDDDAQVAAGTRPPGGVLVLVAGQVGRWEVMRRSPAEQRRYPHAIRVRQEGHTLNASVPLELLTVCPPDVPEPDGGEPFTPRQGVQLGAGQVADGVGEWAVYAAVGGAYVGELWHNRRGEWRAYRRGHGARVDAYPNRSDALAAVGWFEHEQPPA